jgi:hypothetical protein
MQARFRCVPERQILESSSAKAAPLPGTIPLRSKVSGTPMLFQNAGSIGKSSRFRVVLPLNMQNNSGEKPPVAEKHNKSVT